MAHVQQAQHCYGFVQTWAFELQAFDLPELKDYLKNVPLVKNDSVSESLISTVLLPLILHLDTSTTEVCVIREDFNGSETSGSITSHFLSVPIL